jgi:uncharacterized protein (TIGR02246 family)
MMSGVMRTSSAIERWLVVTAAGLLLTAAALGPSARAQRAGPVEDRGLAPRVQLIEDTAAIERLLLEYGRTLDARDFQAYSRLFAKDGVWSGGMGTVQGPVAIQAFMEKAIPGPNSGHSFHLLSNFVIDVQGETATAWSRWQFVVPGPDGKPNVAQAGRYEDTLVREEGRWKFRRRVASNDIPASGPVQRQ